MPERDLRSVAFPTLSPEQLADLGDCGAVGRSTYRDGEALFRVGERDFKFSVVLSGAVEILDLSGPEPRRVALHLPGEFTGDVSHVTGAPRWSPRSRGAGARSTSSRPTT